MPKATKTNYRNQRTRVTPPHLSVKDVRRAVGITIDELLARIHEITGRTYTRGAISALENGLRGGSSDLLEGIALAYGLEPDALDTAYMPRRVAGHKGCAA
jgi:transcriptional regulator with XRE-family HTH domain